MLNLDTTSSLMWSEIHEQADCIEACLRENRAKLQEAANLVRERGITTVVFAARGSSEHAAQVGRYVFETKTGMVSAIALPSTVTCYGAGPDLSHALVVGISQSGGAQDCYEVMRKCVDDGGVCVSITNEPGSIMAGIGHVRMNNACGPELSITAAKSYMTQLVLVVGLAAYISGDEELLATLDDAADVVRASYELEDQVRAVIPAYRNGSHMLVFGRGLLYGLATETELKIQETSYFDARCYAASDYQHGPIATTQRFVPALFFIADRQTNDSIVDLLDRMHEERKIFATVVTNDPDIAGKGEQQIVIPAEFDGLRAVLCCAVISQMFACLLSLSRGYDPDHPEGVSKHTVTV